MLTLRLQKPHFFSGETVFGLVDLTSQGGVELYQVRGVLTGKEMWIGKRKKSSDIIRPLEVSLEGPGSQPLARGIFSRLKKKNSTVLPAGQYQYTLRLQLPPYLPSSCIFGQVRIQYVLTISVLGPRGKPLPDFTREFEIVVPGTQLDFKFVKKWSRSFDRRTSKSPSFSFGRISTRIELATQVFHIGTPITGNIEIRNASNRAIRNLRICFIRKYRNGRKWIEEILIDRELSPEVAAASLFKAKKASFEFKFLLPVSSVTESVLGMLKHRGVQKLKWLSVVYYVSVRGVVRASKDMQVDAPVHLCYNRLSTEDDSGGVAAVQQAPIQPESLEYNPMPIVSIPAVPEETAESAKILEPAPVVPAVNPQLAPAAVVAPTDPSSVGVPQLTFDVEEEEGEADPLQYLQITSGLAAPSYDPLAQAQQPQMQFQMQPVPIGTIPEPDTLGYEIGGLESASGTLKPHHVANVPSNLFGSFRVPSDCIVFDLSAMYEDDPMGEEERSSLKNVDFDVSQLSEDERHAQEVALARIEQQRRDEELARQIAENGSLRDSANSESSALAAVPGDLPAVPEVGGGIVYPGVPGGVPNQPLQTSFPAPLPINATAPSLRFEEFDALAAEFLEDPEEEEPGERQLVMM